MQQSQQSHPMNLLQKNALTRRAIMPKTKKDLDVLRWLPAIVQVKLKERVLKPRLHFLGYR